MKPWRFDATIDEPSRGVPTLHTDAAGSAPPDAFGPFRVLHQIGAGALGPVYRAVHPEDDRSVAIKVFRLDVPPERVHQFVAELDKLIAANLTHPGLAAPIAAGISDVSAYLAQEFAEADSLDVIVRDYGPAPPPDAIRIVTQLAGAFDFAAVVNVTHGALHPRDVLIAADDVRLTGMGIGQALERIGVAVPVRRPYTAPERVSAGRWSRRADVFSLAAVMFELLFGRRVSGTGEQAREAVGEIPGANVRQLRAVFARALAEDAAERFESALEFAEQLKGAFSEAALVFVPRAEAGTAAATDAGASALPRAPLADVTADVTTVAEPLIAGAAASQAEDAPAFHDLELRAAEAARYDEVESAPSAAPSFVGSTTTSVGSGFSRIEPRTPADVEGGSSSRAGSAASSVGSAETSVGSGSSVGSAATSVGSGFSRISPGTPADLGAGYASPPPETRSLVAPVAVALLLGAVIGGLAAVMVFNRSASGNRQPAAVVESVAQPARVAATNGPRTEVVPTEAPIVPVPSSVPPRTSATAAEAGTARPNGSTPPAEPRDRAGAASGGAGAPAAVERTPPAPVAETGRLLVRSTPAGARVLLDGKDVGPTPVTAHDLTNGTHVVRITLDGYTAEERRVAITAARPAQSITVELARQHAALDRVAAAPAPSTPGTVGRFIGVLVVDSRPSGASVFVDGRLAGTTPVEVSSVDAGSHALRIELDGYRRWTSAVRVVAGERNRVTASLER